VRGDRRPLLDFPPAWIKNPSLNVQEGMSATKAEWYRGRAEDCCRNAIISEDDWRRLHWLEAASRWIRLAREEGVLPLRLTQGGMRCRKSDASAKAEATAMSRVNAKTR
jgi:hypothetical protein